MNLSELAALLGVSVSTVSKAFSGSREISESKRQEIFELAKKHNCYSKYIKISPYKYTIGVICPEFKGGFYTLHLQYLEDEIKKHGGLMLTATNNFDNDEQQKIANYFIEQIKVDGIITYGEFTPPPGCSTPVICFSDSRLFDSIKIAYEPAMYEAVEHLTENGHKKIAFIGEPLANESLINFKNAMQKSNMPIRDEYIIKQDSARFDQAGYEAMTKLLSLKDVPTAVIAAYDYIAFGAIKAITERGLKIPEDISVIGRDDVKECEYLNTPLTTITPYSKDLCEIATDALFRRIELKNAMPPQKINVSAQLVKRGTVGKAKD